MNFCWNARGAPPGGKRFMESKLMDYDTFFKEFYAQHKAEQMRKAALRKKIIIAAITIGVICLITTIL